MTVTVDCAGAFMGGAANFLRELDAVLARAPRDVRIIGRGEALSPSWLVRRERLAGAGPRVALNNASFVRPGGPRTVLLRNALHFADEADLASVRHTPSRAWRAQTAIVRATARRADRVVVPCTAMGERVVRFVPSVAERIEVRPHPVSTAPWAEEAAKPQVLVPVLAAPYKHLDEHVRRLLAATESLGAEVVVTGTAEEYSAVAGEPRLRLVGRLSAQELDRHWAESAAVYFPTTLESFGYPLAQARANGRRVIAPDTAQAREIAGQALAPFEPGDPDSLAAAASDALTRVVAPDRETFDPDAYVAWLLDGLA